MTAKGDGLTASRLATLVLIVGDAAILAALAFEHIGGYKPCPLCLRERIAYYAGVPVTLVALVMMQAGRRGFAGVLLALVAVGFLVNAGLGVYHSGVEWKWWAGPTACSGAGGLTLESGSVLEELSQTKVIRCDEAPFRFAYLSFAGWSAVISLGLAVTALAAALRSR